MRVVRVANVLSLVRVVKVVNVLSVLRVVRIVRFVVEQNNCSKESVGSEENNVNDYNGDSERKL